MLTKSKMALWLTLGATVLVTALRAVFTPLLQSMDTGAFAFNYVVMGIILATFIAVGVLLHLGKKELPALPSIKKPWLVPFAVLLMAVGLCLLAVSVVDLYNWSANGITPPPSTALGGTADRVTLFFSLALGILGGVYFMRLGFVFLAENEEVRGIFPLWALTPVFWVWMRLARYEVSYASAVEMHESFFDFAMLLCTMLFLFSFARHMSDVDSKQPWKTVLLCSMTVIMSLSGTLSRVVFFLLGQGDAYRTGQLAGITDFAVGVLALAFLLYWMLTPQVIETPEEETTQTEQPDETDETAQQEEEENE